MRGIRFLVSGVAVVVAVAVVVFALPQSSGSAVGPTKSRVKLFSGGELVGEWEAVGAGRQEGESFVFRVNRGVREVEVRIQGTWSAESLP